MRKHPAEEPVLRLLKDGLGNQAIAKKVGTSTGARSTPTNPSQATSTFAAS